MTLRLLLLLRGTFCLLFALYLLFLVSGASPQVLMRPGTFALVDGVLGLALAIALLRDTVGRRLFGLTLLDALVRIAIGAMTLANPNIESNVLAGAFYFAAVIVVLTALGLAGLVYALLARRGAAGGVPVSLGWPAVIASALTLLLAVGLAVGPGGEARRWQLAAYALAFGLTLLYAGLRQPGRRVRPA